MKKLSGISKKKLVIILVLALLIVASVGGFIFFQYQQQNKTPDNPQAEIQDLTVKVGKLMDLPNDEEPVVATVSDVTKLASQPFFAKALNGDKVLAYSKAKKAILYRPSTNKIIEVTFYNPAVDQATSASKSAVSTTEDKKAESIKVAVYNGTKTAGLAKSKADDLEKEFGEQIEITSTGNAKGDFDEALIVDISGNNSDLVSDIAKSLGGKVGKLPEDEDKPANAQILVILGAK